MGPHRELADSFVSTGQLPAQDDSRMPRAVNEAQPVMAFVFDLGAVGAEPVSRQVIVAYDEVFAIKYFGQKLRPYWRRNGATAAQMLQRAANEYPRLAKLCAEFDAELLADARKVGGENYAYLCALAYRQCLAACGLAADRNGQPLFFTKENTSNGDIATVDVIFPMAPQLILLSPTLAKASIVPILSYAASPHWRFPNAPHDLGTYPIARGTDDGGEGMPVEESGNMLILCDAIAQAEGNANSFRPGGTSLASGRNTWNNTAWTRRTSFAPMTSWATWRTTPISPSRPFSAWPRMATCVPGAEMKPAQPDTSNWPGRTPPTG